MQILQTSVTPTLVKFELFRLTVSLKTRERSPKPNTCCHGVSMQIWFQSQDILR